MLNPSFKNILLYVVLKYIIVYIIFMIATNNFKLLKVGSIRNVEDLFYYLWMILFIPIVNMLLFTAPLFLSFRVKRITYFIILVGLISGLQYLTYVYFTSQRHIDAKGIIIEIIGLILLYTLFFKKIKSFTK